MIGTVKIGSVRAILHITGNPSASFCLFTRKPKNIAKRSKDLQQADFWRFLQFCQLEGPEGRVIGSSSMATRTITFRDIISFSAEHPQNKVQNLLKTGKTGKWTSPKNFPETTIDVELSLPPCYIKSLDVGNHWSAVLEIEVGSTEKKSRMEPLLKSPSTLMSRIDCQIGSNKDAMKFYTGKMKYWKKWHDWNFSFFYIYQYIKII